MGEEEEEQEEEGRKTEVQLDRERAGELKIREGGRYRGCW